MYSATMTAAAYMYRVHCINQIEYNYGLAIASPYVGMARFQDGGSNQCISVFTAISSPGNKY